MSKLSEIVEFLDEKLRTVEIPDYPGAHNGLQLENRGEVTKVATAVDASLPVVKKAAQAGADLLIVHHGMFWQGVQPLTKAFYEKIRIAMEGNLAIYSSHIPLDIHPELGNNVLLMEALGLGKGEPFHPWKGIELGRKAGSSGSLGELREKLGNVVGGPVTMCGDAENPAGIVGVITGGAGSEIASIASEGIETFITGEGPHWSYPLAEELGINFLYGGHYATETFGIRALGKLVAREFHAERISIDHPTGL